MQTKYQVRRISKQRAESLRKSGQLRRGMVIDSISGFLIVEPVGSSQGDGEILDPMEADYELHPAWCLTPKSKLNEARSRLGLPVDSLAEATVGAT